MNPRPSQAEIGRKVHRLGYHRVIGRDEISRFETGRQNLPERSLVYVAAAYGVSYDDLRLAFDAEDADEDEPPAQEEDAA